MFLANRKGQLLSASPEIALHRSPVSRDVTIISIVVFDHTSRFRSTVLNALIEVLYVRVPSCLRSPLRKTWWEAGRLAQSVRMFKP
jgi:hypothetical protein